MAELVLAPRNIISPRGGIWRGLAQRTGSRIHGKLHTMRKRPQATTATDPSEFQKMITGELYNAVDSELLAMRSRTKLLCQEYNNSVGYLNDYEKRQQHLEKLLGKVGPNVFIEPPFRVDYGFNVELGKNFRCNFDVVILDVGKVQIGDNVLVGPGTHFYAAGHPVDVETRHRLGLEFGRPITIGNDCWIGGKVVLVPGATIGDGCVIGAGSIVTKNIPKYSLAVGNPCRVIRQLS